MILNAVGVFGCYLVDGISYLALVGSLRSIQADLSGPKRTETSIKDLVVEGALYAVRDIRLRTLWLFELATAMFGLSYAALMPAYATDVLAHGDPAAARGMLTLAGISIGTGAFLGLLVVTQLANSRRKGWIVRGAMAMIAVGLLGLSLTANPWLAYPSLAMAGAGGIMQLNTTNALFQTLAPERLHGRVLAMHIWALNGLSPFGVLIFGNIARATKGNVGLPVHGGVQFAFALGGALMAVVFVVSFFTQKGLRSLHRELGPGEAPAGASLR
jgi:hypothetical protein